MISPGAHYNGVVLVPNRRKKRAGSRNGYGHQKGVGVQSKALRNLKADGRCNQCCSHVI